VLASDVAGVDYAQLLVGVARHDCKGLLLGAHGVAPGKGSLTRRVQRVLDGTLPRTPMGKGFAAGMFMGVVATAAPLAAITFTPRVAANPSAGLSLVAASPAESLPSLVAQSIARATVETTEAVSVAVAGRQAAEAGALASESVGATAASAHAVAEDARAGTTRLAMAHPHPDPRPRPAPIPSSNRSESDQAIDDAIASKALGITPAYAAAIRSALPGVQIDEGDLMGLRAVGVTPDWLRAMSRAGYRTSDVGDLTGARAVGVSPTYVADLASAGLRNLSLDNLTAMRALGVTGSSIRKLREAGYTGLTPDRIIELRATRIKAFATAISPPPHNWPPNVPRRERHEGPEPPELPEPPEPHDDE
jgi:hypothetical protein